MTLPLIFRFLHGNRFCSFDLLNMHKKENGAIAIEHTSEAKKLKEYFAAVLPNYDEERVYTSNIKKVVQWYNILVVAGFDFTTLEEKEEEETKES